MYLDSKLVTATMYGCNYNVCAFGLVAWYNIALSPGLLFLCYARARSRRHEIENKICLIKHGGEKEGLVATACTCAKNPQNSGDL